MGEKTIRVHADTLEYTSAGLRTPEALALEVGTHNRIILLAGEVVDSAEACHVVVLAEHRLREPEATGAGPDLLERVRVVEHVEAEAAQQSIR
jgi:hypothetical protein